ncbi:MAG: inositol monophosphatase family protein [Bdellovibrionota bacterium]
MNDVRNQLAESELTGYHAFGLELAKVAREIALRHFRAGAMRVDYKEPGQPVTQADTEIETALRERIEERFPAHGIIGEEHGTARPHAELIWTLDPIDGTRNFAAGIDTFGNLISLRFRERPCVGIIDHPARDLCVHACFGRGSWSGERRLRIERDALPPVIATSTYAVFDRTGEGAVLEALLREFPDSRIYYDCFAHSLTALNALRATVEYNLKLWDIAPAELIIEEAGGRYVEIKRKEQHGGPPMYDAVFGEAQMVDELLTVIDRLDERKAPVG